MSSPLNSPLMSKTPEQLKVTELKEELKRRGLSAKGLKKDLVERLEGALRFEEEAAKPVVAEKVAEPEIPVVEPEPEPEPAKDEVVTEATVATETLVVQTLTAGDVRDAGEETVVTETVTTEVTEEIKVDQSTVTVETVEEVKVELAVTTQEPLQPLVEAEPSKEGELKVEQKEEVMEEVKEEVKEEQKEEVMEEVKEEVKEVVPAVEDVKDEQVQDETVVEKIVTEEVETTTTVTEMTVDVEPAVAKDVEEDTVKEADAQVPVTDGLDDKDSKADSEELPESAVTDKVDDSKPMDVDAEAQAGLKRKDSGEGQQVDQNKRQRRWNSGNNLGAEVEARPKAPELTVNVGSNVAGMGSRPSGDRSVSRAAVSPPSDAPNNGRVVSPPKNPTTSLRIDRFVRPFTLKALKDLLAETGTFSDFWMDQIKTHCFITYSSVDEAIATKNALHNVKWPVVGGKTLSVEFVEPEEVKMKCESDSNEKAATTPRAFPPSPHTPLVAAPQREKPAPPPKREAEPILTLDDLFKKTIAKPSIYYLPLTEAQVAAKLAVKT